MTVSVLKKVNLLSLTSTIASAVIWAVGSFAALEINNRAEAIIVPDDPNDYILSPGTGFDGIVDLEITVSEFTAFCSGSLLSTGLHILTAAHCLSSSIDTVDIAPLGTFFTKGTTAFFDLPTGRVGINAAEFYIHPNWNGQYYNGNDLAIIKLAQAAPLAADRYDIYRGNDELGQPSTKAGYGLTGNVNSNERFFDGNKRGGLNSYDVFGEVLNDVIPGLNFAPGIALLYDFDNGNPANDALGVVAGISNLGFGEKEVYPFFGDSGGPTFINGLIAGIISDGIRYPFPSETDNIPYNSSYGEIGFDTRVSHYANYIDDVLAGKIAPTARVPEPNTVLSTVFALGAFAISSCFKRRVKETTTAS